MSLSIMSFEEYLAEERTTLWLVGEEAHKDEPYPFHMMDRAIEGFLEWSGQEYTQQTYSAIEKAIMAGKTVKYNGHFIKRGQMEHSNKVLAKLKKKGKEIETRAK